MRILLVEDSRRLREMLVTGLRRMNFAVDTAADGEDGLRLARIHEFDVIVLDIMLPKMDGLAVLKQLRKDGNRVHVIILTAKEAVPDRVNGLQCGADDYLPKPFAFDELVARIQALTRRKYDSKASQLALGDLVIDFSSRNVTRNSEEIILTGREFALLEYLAMRLGQVVSRHRIEEAIYDGRQEPASNAVDSAICVLRRKIDRSGSASLIQTRRGLGYVLTHCTASDTGEDDL